MESLLSKRSTFIWVFWYNKFFINVKGLYFRHKTREITCHYRILSALIVFSAIYFITVIVSCQCYIINGISEPRIPNDIENDKNDSVKSTEWVTIKRFLLKYNLVTDLFFLSINDVTRTQTTTDIVTSSSSYPRTLLQTVQFCRTFFMDKSSLHFPQHVYQRCVLALL